MLPPVQQILSSASGVTSRVSTRIFQTVAQDQQTKDASGVTQDYIVWQIISAIPGINLSCSPEYDDQLVQVDVYSIDQSRARLIAEAARDALEAVTHVVRGPEPMFEPETELFRQSLDAEFWQSR